MSIGVIVLLALLTLQLVIIFGFVLLERRDPAATLAWILSVMLLPVVGVLLYLFFGLRTKRRRTKTSERSAARVDEALVAQGLTPAVFQPQPVAGRAKSLTKLAENASGIRASQNNRATILHNAANTYRALVDAIHAAKHHIHVEFYIIQPDETGQALRELLVARAAEGVEVRVLCDAVGSWSLPADFWAPLEAHGGEFAYFSPVRLLARFRRRDRINYRNHRKIVVVDGQVGFTGGINVGREYLGLDPDVGEWRDTHVRIDGPAVLALQEVFVEDWLVATDRLLDHSAYFPTGTLSPSTAQAETPATDDDAIVQIVASGPDRPWSLIHRLYFQAITEARDRVWITSPYFIPDRIIQEALVTASLRGVDVRLLVPKRTDNWLVDLASRSYYAELLEAGVAVWEYDRGFVHAKTLVVDDWFGTIGSANMDNRSFHINYELNAFVYGAAFCAELAGQFEGDLDGASPVSADWELKQSYGRRILYSTAGLLSPLL